MKKTYNMLIAPDLARLLATAEWHTLLGASKALGCDRRQARNALKTLVNGWQIVLDHHDNPRKGFRVTDWGLLDHAALRRSAVGRFYRAESESN